MDWPDVAGWKWTAIGTVVGILIALGSLWVSILARKASERSAKASEESADAAKRAVAIQEREHLQAQTANLRILRAHTYIHMENEGVQYFGAPPVFRFVLRNVGGSEAFDLEASAASALKFTVATDASTVAPSEEVFFACHAARIQILNFLTPLQLTFSLAYRDTLGTHQLEAVFELEFEIGMYITASIESVSLDGVAQP